MRFGKGQAINCQSDNAIGCLVVYLECTVIDINYPDMNIKYINNIADRIKIIQFCQIPTLKLPSKVPADYLYYILLMLNSIAGNICHRWILIKKTQHCGSFLIAFAICLLVHIPTWIRHSIHYELWEITYQSQTSTVQLLKFVNE